MYQCTRVTRVGLSQIQKKHKQNLRKHAATPTLTVAPPLPTITTLTASQSSPLTPHSSTSFPAFPSSPPHKDLPDPLPPPSGDHLGGQKGHQTGNTSHGNQSHRARNRDKERKEGPQKRISADAPIPPAKRKNRRRKLSSSNESSTSEAPSNASDFIHASGHQPLEQANANAALREGREGRGLERVAAMRKRESEILTAVPTYSKRDGSRIGSHSVSPVPALETDRGKESAASRYGEMWSRIIRDLIDSDHSLARETKHGVLCCNSVGNKGTFRSVQRASICLNYEAGTDKVCGDEISGVCRHFNYSSSC